MVNNFFHNKVLSAHPDVPENLFSGRSDPFNISANCLRLSKQHSTTVYRYLDKLCAEHVVIKYPDLNSDKAMFQFAGEEKKCTDHLHLKYIRCGKVVHLDCNFMDELKEHLFRDHGFRLQCSGDMLHGICKDCENKSDQL